MTFLTVHGPHGSRAPSFVIREKGVRFASLGWVKNYFPYQHGLKQKAFRVAQKWAPVLGDQHGSKENAV